MKLVKRRIEVLVPEQVAKPLPIGHDNAAIDDAFRCLFSWIGVDEPANIRSEVESGAPWAALASALAVEILPCFKSYRRRRRKSGGALKKFERPEIRAEAAKEYQAAGGSLIMSWDQTSVRQHQEAKFVLCVQSAMGAKKTLAHAFRQLAKEQNRQNWPVAYKGLRTAKALESAYKDVAEEVRKEPDRFVPQPPVPPLTWLALPAERGLKAARIRVIRKARQRTDVSR